MTTLYPFFGGQGTINVKFWTPDSKSFTFVIRKKQQEIGRK